MGNRPPLSDESQNLLEQVAELFDKKLADNRSHFSQLMDDKLATVVEIFDDKLASVVESIDTKIEYHLAPVKADVAELKIDMKVVKAAVTATNTDLKALTTRVSRLEDTVYHSA